MNNFLLLSLKGYIFYTVLQYPYLLKPWFSWVSVYIFNIIYGYDKMFAVPSIISDVYLSVSFCWQESLLVFYHICCHFMVV